MEGKRDYSLEYVEAEISVCQNKINAKNETRIRLEVEVEQLMEARSVLKKLRDKIKEMTDK